MTVLRSHWARGTRAVRVPRCLQTFAGHNPPTQIWQSFAKLTGALRRTEYDPGAVLTGSRQDLGRHLGLGKLYRRSGQCDQAHGHIATAMTMYREIDMQFRLEKAEAEMGELT